MREFDLAEPVGSFTSTVRNVLSDPKAFFSGIALRGSLKNPLIFGVVCLLVSASLEGLVNYLNVPGSESWTTGNSPAGRARDMGTGDILAFGLFGVILTPLAALLRLYIYSGIVHLLVMLLMQQRRDFEATLRTYCYVSTVALLSWIPFVGWIASGYGVVVLVTGLREVHSRGYDRTPA